MNEPDLVYIVMSFGSYRIEDFGIMVEAVRNVFDRRHVENTTKKIRTLAAF